MLIHKVRLCSYVVIKDTGLAPNPFWGYCTLSVCTLNHSGVRAQKGDWFIGTQSASKGSKLVYAMQVSEKLCFDDYYRDPRFQAKKPVINATWHQRCGDNMYYKADTGAWCQHPSLFHREEKKVQQDLKHPFVFIAEHFYYFGDKALEVPPAFAGLIWGRQGCKWYDGDTVVDFLDWLQRDRVPGIHGEPADIPKHVRARFHSANNTVIGYPARDILENENAWPQDRSTSNDRPRH
jgi:hypothetical protein